MEIKTVKLSEKGQIALPLAMRKRAGLVVGEDIVLIERNGRIIIDRADRVAAKLEDDFAAWDAASDEALIQFEQSL